MVITYCLYICIIKIIIISGDINTDDQSVIAADRSVNTDDSSAVSPDASVGTSK